jgi:hypothetical protein
MFTKFTKAEKAELTSPNQIAFLILTLPVSGYELIIICYFNKRCQMMHLKSYQSLVKKPYGPLKYTTSAE